MIFHNYQKVMTDSDIPQLEINNTPIERVTDFHFLGITIKDYMNWGSHSVKIANKICHTLGVMNCLKRYLPLSALKIMYDSLILSHIQFGITCLGFEWGRLAKLQKELFVSLETVNIMCTQNRYLYICIYWKLSIHLMSSVWNFGTNSPIIHFQTICDLMFQYNSSLHDIETRNHDRMHVVPTRTFGARNVLRHHLPVLVYRFPADLIRKAQTHSITAFSNHIKHHLLESYSHDCIELNCYVCNKIAL